MDDYGNTEVILWNVTCNENGHQSTTFALTGDGYGHLLGRTRFNEVVSFNSWEDPVFDDVAMITKDLLKDYQGVKNCFGLVLGVACDPAGSGERYDFSGQVWCTICGTSNVDYGPNDPAELKYIHLSSVTHVEWNQLDQNRRRELLRSELVAIGCLK